MSIVYDIQWYKPKNASSAEDIAAARRGLDFDAGLYAHPVFLGGWPPEAEKRIAERSRLANLPTSRLPAFSPEEIAFINGTHDFFGVNIYTGVLIENLPEYNKSISSYEADVHSEWSFDPNWTLEAGLFAYAPDTPLHVLKYVKETYNNPDIMITEIGASDDGSTLYDHLRVKLFQNYFDSILRAIYDHGVNMIGLTIWSLLDNFEWASGYGIHFGIYYVDMDDPRRTRYPKMSTVYVKQLTSHNRLPAIDSIEPMYRKIVGNVTSNLNRILDKLNSPSQVRRRSHRPHHHLAAQSRRIGT